MSIDRILTGHHAVVTGGGRGIGAAIAERLAGMGATLTLMGRSHDTLHDAAARMRAAYGTDVAAVACDVTDEDGVAHAFSRASAQAGAPAILINNAGQSEGAPFLQTGRDLWDRMLAVNLTGAYLCTRQVLAAMLRAQDGRIVNIASTSGLRGYRNVTAYAAAKHGLIGLTRALAAETVKAGITVNAVCPAYTDTDMARNAILTVARDYDRTEEEARSMIERTVQRGTLIRPGEVAAAVAWLCTPDAGAITGQAIVVAGGEL